MRFLAFLFGIVVGVGGAVAYMVFTPPVDAVTPSKLPSSAPLTVTFGEPLITGLLQRGSLRIPGASVPPDSLRAEVGDGVLTVRATVDIAGRQTQAKAVLRPIVDQGTVRVEAVEGTLGVLPVPALQQLLDEQVNPRLRTVFGGLPATVTGVALEHDRGLSVSAEIDLTRLPGGG